MLLDDHVPVQKAQLVERKLSRRKVSPPMCQRSQAVMAGVSHVQAARSALPAITAWLRWHIGGETFRRDNFLSTNCAFCTGSWSSKSKNW